MKPSDINILVGCEESQAVLIELRKLGFNAFSCDLKQCSGNMPQFHIKGDIFKAIERQNGFIMTSTGHLPINKWHALICFPDCTYTCSSGLHWNGRLPGRSKKTDLAIEFDKRLLNTDIEFIAMENPTGCISTRIRKPDQIIQPWQFGHPESKGTCLWLKNLPLLKPTEYADFKMYRCKCGYTFEADLGKYGCANCAGTYVAKPMWDNQTKSGQNKLGPSPERATIRSKTYPGIAKAMAEQWGNYIFHINTVRFNLVKQI